MPVGAPKGNQNGVTHGLKLRCSDVPAKCNYVRIVRNQLRDVLTTVVEERKGEVSLVDACYIQSATKWETHSQLAARWLRLHAGDMTHQDKLAYSREVARASSERDKCVEKLGLTKVEAANVVAGLYTAVSQPLAEDDSEPTGNHQDAAESVSGPQEGKDDG